MATDRSNEEVGRQHLMIAVQFKETDEVFANPGKGWMPFRRLPEGEPRLPCSVAYTRWDWCELEPVEREYAWQLIDKSMEAWSKRGVSLPGQLFAPFSTPSR
jgi:hypothetical protein